ncbi:MAG: M20/M25/M40 family metallo-hydrolase [Planctomycetota bacterium]|jgi:Zn-dependent M28 family amino/carboxypeptidase
MKARHQLISILVAVGLILAIAVPTALAESHQDKDINNLFKGDKTFAQIEALVGFGPRVTGTPAELAAAEYIAAEMESYGLEVEIQEFDIIYFEELSDPELEQVTPNPTVYQVHTDFATMDYSVSGDVTASLQAVDLDMPPTSNSTSGCEAADFAGFTPGNIALIQRGTCYYSTKAEHAQNAGAVGVIIFNEGNTPGRIPLMYGTLGGLVVDIPVQSASFALGFELYNLTLGGVVMVDMFVDTITEIRTSQNVIGTLEGLQPEQGIVYIGGHYDSVSSAPGANDDASGVAATLEAARVLSTKGHRTKATLKFIAFGAEEIGLDGSYWYVVENYGEVTSMGLGMVNLDMIGVGDTLQIGNMAVGPIELTDYATEKAEAWDLAPEYFEAMCNSDHCYFEQVGVPVAFLTQRPDPYYHTPEDDLDKIQVDTLEDNGELATAVMYDWAMNPVLREKKAAKFERVHVRNDKVLTAE